MTGPEQKAALVRLEVEHDNLRRAVASGSSNSEAAEERLRLTFALHRFWFIRSHFSEGRKWIDDALADRDGVSGPVVANALNGAGVLAYAQGDYAAARGFFEDCRALWQGLGNTLNGTDALNNLGMVSHAQKDYPTARSYYSECVTVYRDLGNTFRTGMALGNLATVATDQHDFDLAHALLEQSLALFRESEDRWCILTSLSNLGELALRQANYPAAEQYYRESLELAWELRDHNSVSLQLNFLGIVACHRSDRHRAVLLLSAAESARSEIGAPLKPQQHEEYASHVSALRSEMTIDTFESVRSRGMEMSLEQAVTYALQHRDDD
jgi:tetratricopeptide (TPR) repeat protein